MKRILSTIYLIALSKLTMAQKSRELIEPIIDEIEYLFPWISGGILLTSVLFNFDNVFGRDRNYKAGVMNISMVLIVFLVVGGIYKIITTSRL